MWAARKRCSVFVVTALVVLTMVVPQVMAYEGRAHEERSAELMTFDLIFMRPLGLAATVVGTAVFLVSLPFSALGGNTGEAAQKLVVDPAKFTFSRPLGQND